MIAVLGKSEFAALVREVPNNESRNSGYALIDVSPAQEFERKHVPNALNIPAGDVAEIRRRFSKDKLICLCCNRKNRSICAAAAQQLSDSGYHQVLQYDLGVEAWRKTADESPCEGDNYSVQLGIEAESAGPGVTIIDSD